MRLRLKVANAVLGFLCIYSLLYTFAVYLVVESLYATGNGLWWRTSPAGALFPIPQHSGMLEALSQVSELDKAIYFGLIVNNLLILIDLALITLLAASVVYTVKHVGAKPK